MKLIESLGYISGVYTPLMQRLLQHDNSLDSFHHGLASSRETVKAATTRSASFDQQKRKILVQALNKQYEHIATDAHIRKQIDLLAKPNTVTVTTGHQLNIFTGPLFFWYKILDVINMVEQLQKEDTTNHYVPVFWMASEDHDFEEINHFFLGEQKVRWEAAAGGPVGRMNTKGLDAVFDTLIPFWNKTDQEKELLTLFNACYAHEDTLAKATRKLVHHLFGKYGIVVVDGDDAALKAQFIPTLKAEVLSETTRKTVAKTTAGLGQVIKKYTPQVNPRDINLFYMYANKRVRITQTADAYGTLDHPEKWTLETLTKEIEDYPDRFSPNALMRPLYQECVLPNVAYVGGGGELAYWLQLKATFEAFDIPYPLLHHRTSVLLLSAKQVKKCTKLDLPFADLFLPSATFINKRVRQISDIDIDFTPQRELLQQQFTSLHDLAKQTDKSFLGAVEAQEKKQLKGLDVLEKRLLKAQRKKLEDHVIRITDIRNDVFPHNRLQERSAHFASFVKACGVDDFTQQLKATLANATNGVAIVQHG